MFGLGRKTITPSEFGQCAIHMAHEILSSDAARSLGSQLNLLPGPTGWAQGLERAGVRLEDQKLYYRLFVHSAFQAACLHMEDSVRREIVHGVAVKGFNTAISGYDFSQEFIALESVYRCSYRFGDELPLSSDVGAGIKNARYLLDRFVLHRVPHSRLFLEQFEAYATTIDLATQVAGRALATLSRSFKF